MSDKSTIEWTDATWNPTVGCSIVSPGCTNCYAMKVAHGLERRFGSKKYGGLTKVVNGNAVWTGEVRLDEVALHQPFKWKRGRRIFVNSMSDLFHESLSDADIDRVFAVMALCPQHTFQVLTKRAERMRDYVLRTWETDGWAKAMLALGNVGPWQCHFPLPNVWLGASCERQQEADERIPLLLQTSAAVRFISAEPLLGPIEVGAWLAPKDFRVVPQVEHRYVHWVIVGGESGPSARPMHPQWARDIRDQCAAANVAFFFKQWGEHAPIPISENRPIHPRRFYLHGRSFPFEQIENYVLVRCGKKTSGRHLDGKLHNEFPMPLVTGGESPGSLRSHEPKNHEAPA